MSVIDMRGYMASDLGATFLYDFPLPVLIQGTQYYALQDDLQTVELDNFGGPEDIDAQKLHFPTFTTTGASGNVILGLPSIENGIELSVPFTVTGPAGNVVENRTKIVVGSVTSADGNELIVTVRGN